MPVILTEIQLFYPDLPDTLQGLTILHVGDLHSSGWHRREKLLYQLIRRHALDMIVFSGDMCHQIRLGNPFHEKNAEDRPLQPGLGRHGLVLKPHWRQSLAVTDRLLEGVDCPIGVFFVQGNHDCPEFMAGLQSRPVCVLDNSAVQVSTPAGGLMNVIGCGGYGRAAADIPAAVADVKPGLFSLAISHFPEFSRPLDLFGANLILAGHTHGGQVCLPGRKAIKTHSRTRADHVSGLTRTPNGYQFTTRGLGTSMFPIRICCPPEITLFTLRRGEYDAVKVCESPVA